MGLRPIDESEFKGQKNGPSSKKNKKKKSILSGNAKTLLRFLAQP